MKGVVGFFQRDNVYVGYYLFINPSREHGANFPNCALDDLLYASHTHTVDVSQLDVRAMSRVEDMIFFRLQTAGLSSSLLKRTPSPEERREQAKLWNG